MMGWHHRLNGYVFEQAPKDGEGQGSLACCSPWDQNELDMIQRLNNKNNGSFNVHPSSGLITSFPEDLLLASSLSFVYLKMSLFCPILERYFPRNSKYLSYFISAHRSCVQCFFFVCLFVCFLIFCLCFLELVMTI